LIALTILAYLVGCVCGVNSLSIIIIYL
jgi:hypothetical protein